MGHYTFISYDVTDKSAAEKLKKYLGDNSVTCVLSRKYDFHQAAKEVISKVRKEKKRRRERRERGVEGEGEGEEEGGGGEKRD